MPLGAPRRMQASAMRAQNVAARFPQAQLLVVPGVGHSTTTADFSGCAQQKVRSWMLGANVAGACPRSLPLMPTMGALPAPGAVKPRKRLTPLQTYSVATKTISDAETSWITASLDSTVPGIWAGKLTPSGREFTLTRYAIARGVELSGKIKLTNSSLPLRFQGTLTVAGTAASAGLLGLNGTSLRGTLGGKIVGR